MKFQIRSNWWIKNELFFLSSLRWILDKKECDANISKTKGSSANEQILDEQGKWLCAMPRTWYILAVKRLTVSSMEEVYHVCLMLELGVNGFNTYWSLLCGCTYIERLRFWFVQQNRKYTFEALLFILWYLASFFVSLIFSSEYMKMLLCNAFWCCSSAGSWWVCFHFPLYSWIYNAKSFSFSA